MTSLLLLAAAVFAANIPCGHWRDGLKKLSPLWFVAIHLPIPFIILARELFDIERTVVYWVIMLPAYFFGQRTGALIRRRRAAADKAS